MRQLFMALLSGALVLSGTAHAAKKAPPKKAPAKKVAAKPNLVCPVMNTKVASVKTAAGKSVYKGKTYYFCCAGCKPEFDKNPEKYVGQKKAANDAPKNDAPKKVAAASLTCPVTGEKIASADKAAGKSDFNGKTYYFCCGGCKSQFDADPAKFTAKGDEKDAHAGHNH
jgi:P-type Cu+ transporter